MQLSGKKIILAVTGSIAAYKTPQLVRLLIKAGAEVKVILTDAAAKFVSPLSLATVSKHPVFSSVSDGAAWNNHVELGLWADVMLIAPCSANTLAKLANGLCDTLVNAVYLSARCPVFIAPAMDEDMWLHASTRINVEKVRSFGNHIVPVGHGELASGLVGEGRMAEPEQIVDYLGVFFTKELPLKGKKALVTAGPTYERIDPVRFIGNFSTGKMGIALAEELAEQGAEVTLVLGPSHLSTAQPGIETVHVESAEQMYEACMKFFPAADMAILSAAVADFRPDHAATEKIKKNGDTLELKLVQNKDILASLGAAKKESQLLVGFALETNNEHSNALKKLQAKNADMIVLNSLRDEGAGFGHDTNKITIIDRGGDHITLPLQSKKAVAAAIVKHILELQHVQENI
ncbi:bifunctional phosphopantothenoylcysteine decarboxylase/phosphopantothenate--cysteine ligase CoaBC [Chitinophagaceae bacterium MMS25-I14]